MSGQCDSRSDGKALDTQLGAFEIQVLPFIAVELVGMDRVDMASEKPGNQHRKNQ